MPKKINEIINQYNGDSTLYELLKNYYNDKALLESKPDDISEIKQLVANYYLSKYPYKDYYDNAVQDRFISKMTEYYTLKVKTRNINNKILSCKNKYRNGSKLLSKIHTSNGK